MAGGSPFEPIRGGGANNIVFRGGIVGLFGTSFSPFATACACASGTVKKELADIPNGGL